MEEMTYTGKGVGVAVLDTGIFPHSDFEHRIVCFQDFVQKRSQPYDDNGHGTHVAGILAGSGAASGGRCRGVAPGCHLVGLKVLDKNGIGVMKHTLWAFAWLREHYMEYKIRVVNISVGTITMNRFQQEAVIRGAESLWDLGMVVVAAAGNRGPLPGSITAPGSSKKVITVGSSDMITGGPLASGSGPTSECVCKPDIVCCGYRILSCSAAVSGKEYTVKSGTSMSTPHISGAAALALERDPLLTNVEIKMMLKDCARDLGYSHNQQGWGEFDLRKFMN